MNPLLDLNLLFLARQGEHEITELPDLYAVTPPRRTARGREADSLIIYMSMTGNSPLSPDEQTQLLEGLAQKFYKTAGSLTSALRTVTEALSLYLLDRNLRSTSVGRQGIGQLILVALRNDTLYMAQCGLVHAFLVTPRGTQYLADLQSSGRGLGLSRTNPIRYQQVSMSPDDFMVLTTQAAPGWTSETIKHPMKQGIEALRRQLLERGNQDVNAVIVQAQAGTGKLRILKRRQETPGMERPLEATAPIGYAAPMETAGPPGVSNQPSASSSQSITTGQTTAPVEDRKLGIPPVTPIHISPDMLEVKSEAESQPLSASIPEPVNLQPPISYGEETGQAGVVRREAAARAGSTAVAETPSSERNLPRTSAPSRVLGSIGRTLSAVGSAILRALRSALATLSGALLRLLKNLLPDADVFRLPSSMMLFIVLAIPIVLATIGVMVFLQRGRAQQSDIYYQKAAEQAKYAASLTNPVEQRLAWQTVLGFLDKAEYYTSSSQTQSLRTQTVATLDNLDAVKRLDYKPALVGGLDPNVKVTRMFATATDLYMLNAQQGSVIRAIMTGRGYEIDPSFQCGPTQGPIDVGPLVDIAELPAGSFENASVLGMDANGNLLYCVVGGQPYSAAIAPPNTGLGEPIAMTLDRSDLYVLDPKVNAVWIYEDMVVREQPRLFFGDYVPPMEDVIDLAVYNDDLYLLHGDGHTTKCTYSALAQSPTRCDDPYPYSDNRPGRVHGPLIEDAVFNQIYFLSFPERSIYMLDPQNQAIYYFSVLLNLQWQYQPVAPLERAVATAFAISPNRTAFLAIGNSVYYAAMP